LARRAAMGCSARLHAGCAATRCIDPADTDCPSGGSLWRLNGQSAVRNKVCIPAGAAFDQHGGARAGERQARAARRGVPVGRRAGRRERALHARRDPARGEEGGGGRGQHEIDPTGSAGTLRRLRGWRAALVPLLAWGAGVRGSAGLPGMHGRVPSGRAFTLASLAEHGLRCAALPRTVKRGNTCCVYH